jgi:hypothetical protein
MVKLEIESRVTYVAAGAQALPLIPPFNAAGVPFIVLGGPAGPGPPILPRMCGGM